MQRVSSIPIGKVIKCLIVSVHKVGFPQSSIVIGNADQRRFFNALSARTLRSLMRFCILKYAEAGSLARS
jgi:hypothetical protein